MMWKAIKEFVSDWWEPFLAAVVILVGPPYALYSVLVLDFYAAFVWLGVLCLTLILYHLLEVRKDIIHHMRWEEREAEMAAQRAERLQHLNEERYAFEARVREQRRRRGEDATTVAVNPTPQTQWMTDFGGFQDIEVRR